MSKSSPAPGRGRSGLQLGLDPVSHGGGRQAKMHGCDPAVTRAKGLPIGGQLEVHVGPRLNKTKEYTSPGDPNPAESGIQKLGHSGLQGLGVPRIQRVRIPPGYGAP